MGRVIAIGILFVGTGFIAMITAAIAERFMTFVRTDPRNHTADAEVMQRLDDISARLDAIEKKL